MSHTLPQQVPFKLRQRPRRLAFLAVPLAIASIGGTLIWALDDDDSSPLPQQAVPADTNVGGPDESARGQSVASATNSGGVSLSGPNESARGQSVASASGAGIVSTSGPDESARGQSVASASETSSGGPDPDGPNH